MPTRTQVGPYYAVTDLGVYPKPALPTLGPAPFAFTDPTFLSRLWRVTDGNSLAGSPNTSFRTLSNHHGLGWSSDGKAFIVVSSSGASVVFTFDPVAVTWAPHVHQPLFQNEPIFSAVSSGMLYGTNAAGSLVTIDKYDLASGNYDTLLDLAPLGATTNPQTYVGGVNASVNTERIVAWFGGPQQDTHFLVVVFDRWNSANRHLLNTQASTLDGHQLGQTLGFAVHHAAIDRSGRYVMLYPAGAQPYQCAVWDTQTGTIIPLPQATTLSAGHDSFGYGIWINHDCGTPYDGLQWQYRTLAAPLTERVLLPIELTPEETYNDDHQTWNHIGPDNAAPFLTAIYRWGASLTAPWRPLDDEIVAVSTTMPGQTPTIWRFAHHRIDQTSDLDPTSPGAYDYQPIPQTSPDGKWLLFDSNWEKTLGLDPSPDDLNAAHRTDVFLLQLAGSAPSAAPSLANVITTLQAALAELQSMRSAQAPKSQPEVGGIAGPAALGFHAANTGD